MESIIELRVIHLTGLLCGSMRSPWPIRRGEVEARGVPSFAWWDGRSALGLWVGDEVAVAHRVVGDGEFKQAVEDHAFAA